MAENPEDLPLVERIARANYLSRELTEHLRQAYLPRLSALVRASREYDPEVVSDQQILDRTNDVLEADKFAADLYQKLRSFLDSIRGDVHQVIAPQESSIVRAPMLRELGLDPDNMP